MANINKKPSHVARLGRNGFDMSQRRLFTSSVGQLLPVYYDILNPGDKIKASSDIFTRTQPLQTSAFIRATEHVDWFFVPMEQLLYSFSSLFYGINDVHTSFLIASNYKGYVPSPTLSEWLDAAFYVDENRDAVFDEMGVPFYYNSMRMFELLGFGSNFTNMMQGADPVSGSVRYSPLLFCAYQKIFFDYYRDTDRTNNDPYAYNLDRYINSSLSSFNIEHLRSMIKLRYRPWKKDYFTNVQSTPLFDQSIAANQSGLSQVSLWKNLPEYLSGVGDRGHEPTGSSLESANNFADIKDYTASSSLNNLRAMYATDKLLRITGQTPKHYDAQTLAHFGKSVPQGVKNEVYYLGGQVGTISINDVVATATVNDGSTLGELAGKGFGRTRTGKSVSFEAPCHGILMAIYSCVPDADYSSEGLDRVNTYYYGNDFYKPEFDELGMQPLFGEQVLGNSDAIVRGQLLGWQYRYSELKSKYDVVCGAFNAGLQDWVAKKNSTYYFGYDGVTFNRYSSMPYYINPNYYDSVFLLKYQFDHDPLSKEGSDVDDRSSYAYDRDPLLHSLQFNVYKTSVMSTYGLPRM